MDNLNSIINKLKHEHSFYQERLKLIFAIGFRDDEKAYEKWHKFCTKHDYNSASKILKDKPQSFGKLNGSLFFGFKKNQQRHDAELALIECQYHAKKLYLTQLQLKEAIGKKNEKILILQQHKNKQNTQTMHKQTTSQNTHNDLQ